MMQGMMECCGGMWGGWVMAGTGILILLLLVLAIAALAKYVFRTR
jgi:hypothetical protein